VADAVAAVTELAEVAEARSQSGKAVEDVVLLFEAFQLCYNDL